MSCRLAFKQVCQGVLVLVQGTGQAGLGAGQVLVRVKRCPKQPPPPRPPEGSWCRQLQRAAQAGVMPNPHFTHFVLGLIASHIKSLRYPDGSACLNGRMPIAAFTSRLTTDGTPWQDPLQLKGTCPCLHGSSASVMQRTVQQRWLHWSWCRALCPCVSCRAPDLLRIGIEMRHPKRHFSCINGG